MKHVSDWLTHIDNTEDVPYLRSRFLDVNIRLFRVNKAYREIVLSCCQHITHHCLQKLEGYKLPHGSSGANLGIPWNIIGIVHERGTPKANVHIMLNPKIKYAVGSVVSHSNCGSIRLNKPIAVKRFRTIDVEWFDLEGLPQFGTFHETNHGFTIQHEIDHNQGILITDRT